MEPPASLARTAICSGQMENKTVNALQQRKFPLGAKVSPLSPFFNERAKNYAVEQAKASFMKDALQKLDESAEKQQARFRTRSHSTESKDSESGLSTFSCGASSSTSNDSTDSSHSFATAISLMEVDQLPRNLPRISYEDWSKFGISLFTPKSANPYSKMYYHYPPMETNKNCAPSHIRGNRPRSQSSLTPSVSAQHSPLSRNSNYRLGSAMISQLSENTTSTSPLSRNQLSRFNSVRVPMERNHTSNY